MNAQIEFFGIKAELNVITLEHNLGELKELKFTCSKDIAEKIIKDAVKRGFPFERSATGVTIYN